MALISTVMLAAELDHNVGRTIAIAVVTWILLGLAFSYVARNDLRRKASN